MFGQNISSNITHFFIHGDKIQNLLWRIKNLKFPSNASLSCIFILCGTNNVDDNSPEEIVSLFHLEFPYKPNVIVPKL